MISSQGGAAVIARLYSFGCAWPHYCPYTPCFAESVDKKAIVLDLAAALPYINLKKNTANGLPLSFGPVSITMAIDCGNTHTRESSQQDIVAGRALGDSLLALYEIFEPYLHVYLLA